MIVSPAAFGLFLADSGLTAATPKYHAGVATVDITPTEHIRLSGYSMNTGYSNDVMACIPSKRVIAEGGYEVLDCMYYYGLPG